MGLIGSVQGSFHQGNLRAWYFGGAQCTIIAMVAIIYAASHLGPSQWEILQINNIWASAKVKFF
jgi:hypothetical protein